MTSIATAPRAATIMDRLSAAGRGYVAMTVATLGASFVVQVTLGREFGPAGLGQYAATSLFVSIMTTLVYSGAAVVASQRVARLAERGDMELHGSMSVSFGLALAGGAVAGVLGWATWDAFVAFGALPRPASALIVAAASTSAVLLQFANSLLLAQLRFGTVTLVSLMQPAAVGAGLSVHQWFGLDSSTLATVGFIAAGMVATLTLVAAGLRPKLGRDEVSLQLRRVFSSSILPYASILTTWVDRAVVIGIAGVTGLGWFVAASYMTESLLRIPRGLGAFGVPAYARLADDPIGIRRVLDSHIRIVGSLLIVAGAALVGAGGGIITFIFGDDFVLGRTALRLLAIGIVPVGIALTLAGNALGTERFRHTARVLGVVAPLQVVVAVAATSWFSIAGTAFAGVVVWSVAVALMALDHGHQARILSTATLARLAAAWMFASVMAWSLGSTVLPWPVAAVASAAIAIATTCAFLLRQPEIRLVSRLVGRAPLTARGAGPLS